jgi:hypothetical protein
MVMLIQLIEHMIKDFQELADACDRAVDVGTSRPIEYYQGYGTALRTAHADLVRALNRSQRKAATPLYAVDRLLDKWLDPMLDGRDRAEGLRRDQPDAAAFERGQSEGFAYAYMQIVDLLEYIRTAGDKLDDALETDAERSDQE